MGRTLPAGRTLVNHPLSPDDGSGEDAEVPDPRLKEIAARILEVKSRQGIKSFRSFSDKAGLSDAHVRQAVKSLSEGKTITLSTLLRIADGGGVAPGWLLSGNSDAEVARLRQLPNWPKLEAGARAKYKLIPDFAIDIVGSFSMDVVPDEFDEDTVAQLASAWFQAASDEMKAHAEGAFIDRKSAKKRPPSK